MLVIDMPMIIHDFHVLLAQVHQWILLGISQKVATSGAQKTTQFHKTGAIFPNELPAIQLDLLRI